MFSDNQKIGFFLTGVGLFFTFIGILLFFDRGLMAIGNLCFALGTSLLIGLRKTLKYFSQKGNRIGAACFFGGIILVIFGRTFIGFCVEAFGFVNLFGDFLPTVFAFLEQIPYLGAILRLPGIRWVVAKSQKTDLPGAD